MNNPICTYVFIKNSKFGFAIVAVYIDDLNLMGTLEELTKTANYIRNEFKMKDFGLGCKLNIFQMEFLFISQHT